MRDWMKQARERKGMTMLQAAQKLGITESYYSLIEKRERQKVLDLAITKKLADLFGITVQEIVEKENI